ncbi:hypothetical protein TELCIR_06449 [Teladorsagia circumcincta]|uniref:Phosphatidylethanolamine-binding protein n=1 Tax=Teladorsagia circumcincta TaxID=45464 RepID=A0A2G9UMX4_TELCI|nr:hypothetical protein TELCIR_06449 [Teladorsagia circumcincta]
MPYGSPAPQPRTDIHRYVILMWEHQGRRINVPKPSTRAKFNVKQFIEKHKLEALILPTLSKTILLTQPDRNPLCNNFYTATAYMTRA